MPLLYNSPMPAKGYRPMIRPKNLRTSVPKKQIRDAVRKAVEMEKNDPVGYEAWLKKHEDTVVRLVPG
jgi:hypothetical protein